MKSLLRLLAIVVVPSLQAAGDDNPPAGQSLFDQIIDQHGTSSDVVPYPFPRLLDTIQSRLGLTSKEQPLATILIPRGRSLHRESARPEYYRFPRIVIALDKDGPGLPLVKNRLFLGYQERAESIEVISYNETAGRFEFQVIENYAAGKTAKIRDANRKICTSCHQNEAPIFARPLWRETNFNPGVAARIAEHHEQYQGIGTGIEHAQADRVDFATDQSNLLSAYQRVWQQGCAHADCRAALFVAALLRRFDGTERTDYAWLRQEREFLEYLEMSWQQKWPQGMPVASGDIEDRVNTDGEDPLSPEQLPTNPRAPLAYWSARTAAIRTLEGFADQFLPASDLVRLQALYRGKSIDDQQIESAIHSLRSHPETTGLFRAKPIPGPALMQALLAAIETHE